MRGCLMLQTAIEIIRYGLIAIVIAFMVVDFVFFFTKNGRAVLGYDFRLNSDDLSKPQKKLLRIHHFFKSSSVMCLIALWLLRYVFKLI